MSSPPTRELNAPVEVLVDRSGRLGALSYRVPDGLPVTPGDAVTVPFGNSTREGVVLGPSSQPGKATKALRERHGRRIHPADLHVASQVADFHGADLVTIAARLAPAKHRDAAPSDPGPLQLTQRAVDVELPDPVRNWSWRLLLRPPAVDPARLAACEAVRLASEADGQVLVLCPTVQLITRVLAELASGAVRLDSRARAGAWTGWRTGVVPVAVGSRAAALYSAKKLAGIVVAEEEHPGHVEASLPYTHARSVAVRRARAHGCRLTLTSASPSAAGIGSGVKVLPLPAAKRAWPAVRIVDRTQVAPSQRQVLPQVRAAVDRAVKDQLEIVALAERAAARRLCGRCNEVRPCDECEVSGCSHRPSQPCGRCQATTLRWVGWDAGRLSQALPAAVPVTFTELQKLPRKPRLVLVLNADPLLKTVALEPQHTAASVLLRAAEAAGAQGQLLVTTSQPGHAVVARLRSRDQEGVAKDVYEHARAQALPPFGHLVTVRTSLPSAPRTDQWPGQIHGPRRRDGEWELLVHITSDQIDQLRPHLDRARRRGKTRLWIR